MPKVNWSGSISAEDIDDFDRDGQYVPYSGPTPINGVYAFRIKVFKYQQKPGKKWPQLQVGLELVPRADRPEDKAYKGYFQWDYPPIAKHTAFRYVPLLDAIGVSGTDFINKVFVDEEGTITKIGRWRNTGDHIILAGIADDTDDKGNPRKKVNSYGIFEGDVDEYGEDEDEDEYEYEYDEDEDEDEYDEDA